MLFKGLETGKLRMRKNKGCLRGLKLGSLHPEFTFLGLQYSGLYITVVAAGSKVELS